MLDDGSYDLRTEVRAIEGRRRRLLLLWRRSAARTEDMFGFNLYISRRRYVRFICTL